MKLSDGRELTLNLLHEMSSLQMGEQGAFLPIIPLIKAYREVSHKGLKDSKETIEACADKTEPCSNGFGCRVLSFNFQKIMELFKPYLTETELTEAKDAMILSGVECAMKNAAILGYQNKYWAAIAVIERFRDRQG